MIGHARDSHFPPPWMVQDQNDDRFAVACFYYDRRAAANLMTRAERVSANRGSLTAVI
jgi:hypothetical protein